MGALIISAPIFSHAANSTKAPARGAAPPKVAAPKVTAQPISSWNYQWVDDEFESQWAWRTSLGSRNTYESRVACGFKTTDALADGIVVAVKSANGKGTLQIWRQTGRKRFDIGQPISVDGSNGELALHGKGQRLRVLWNGQLIQETQWNFEDAKLGYGTVGVTNFRAASLQPTEPVIFRDDFMRAQAPGEEEVAGEWRVRGLWQTSGSLGPKSDAALNPNPFVFRASAPTISEGMPRISEAIAGKWFWTDYAVTASVKPVLGDSSQPLVAGLEAYRQADGTAIRAEVDFRTRRASLLLGEKVLGSAPVNSAEPDQWHKIRLEPGPGNVRLIFNGQVVLSANCTLAQGQAALSVRTAGSNHVDFDDVRIGAPNQDNQWGEPPLPDRFTKDRLMQHWASNARAWKRDNKGTWWHTGDFFGPVTVELPLPELKEGTGIEILRADEAGQVLSRFAISREVGGQLEWKWEREGQAASGQTPSASSILRVSDFGARLGDVQLFQRPPVQNANLKLRGVKTGLRPTRNGAAIPLPKLEKVSMESGSFEREGRAVIGVNITPVTPEIAKDMGLPDPNGAIVDAIEGDSPAVKAGVKVGDVIRAVEGKTIVDVESLRTAVGARRAGDKVKFDVLRRPTDLSGLDWEKVFVHTPKVVDYSFTSAPVDWHSAKGRWEVAERWTCSPQWSFFGGLNDTNPTLWSRFTAGGNWTLEAYLATPMDLARGERSPVDLNLTVGGDGRDLASGYSFLFGAKNRTVNQIRRGDTVAWTSPFEMPAGVGDTHQDWFYVRLERRNTAAGARFRYSVNGRLITEYVDPKPLTNQGHFAFWTVNGGLSIARVRLWSDGVQAGNVTGNLTNPIKVAAKAPVASPTLRTITFEPKGGEATAFTPRVDGQRISALVSPVQNGARIQNPQSGGDWTVYLTRKAFDARQQPRIEFEYKIPAGVKVNMYVKVDGLWREVQFAGSRRYAEDGDAMALGRIEPRAIVDGAYHKAEFDILAALRRKGIDGDSAKVEALALAAPDTDYLRAGFGGNRLGAQYEIRNFRTVGSAKKVEP